MSTPHEPEEREIVVAEEATQRTGTSEPQPVFWVFVFTDLVGSTDLKRRLGDLEGARLIARSNELFRKCLSRFGGVEQDNAGDGFFAHFEVPSHAVACALAFQRELADLDAPERLYARVGIHLGEAIHYAEAGSPVKALRGLAVDTAARVMGLGLPGQLLLTRHAFDSVRQNLRAAPDGSPVEWLAHGPYKLQGLEEAIEVFEVGVSGVAPLEPPPDSAKAHRAVVPGDDETLGWRPAVGLEVPHRRGWFLERKLGVGGFGEVWLAAHHVFRDRRVFKFCFQADRLRGLKREIVLFRLLKEALGERDDIVRILDWEVEHPPFFIESEYTGAGNLLEFAEDAGGAAALPIDARLEIVAQIAEALGAAHSVGVLHKDIKPSNVLVRADADGRPHARLADFGIGLITDRALLDEKGIPATGLTETAVAAGSSSGSGTRLYMAPELVAGCAPTTDSDIFSLGVLLYQAVVADFRRPLGVGWEREVADELMREDVAACIDVLPSNRLHDARELATRLRRLGERRAARAAERRAAEERSRVERDTARRRRRNERRRYVGAIGLGLLTLPLITMAWMQLTRSTEKLEDTERIVIDQALNHNLMTAVALAEVATRKLDRARREIEAAAAGRGLQHALATGQGAAIERQLQSAGALGTGFHSLGAADRAGVMRARVPHDDSVIGQEFSYRDWFNGLGDGVRGEAHEPIGDTHISQPFVSRAKEGHEMIAVSAPVVDPISGTAVGVLYGTFTLDDLRTWVNEIPEVSDRGDTRVARTDAVDVVLLNERRQVVLHPRNPLEPGGAPAVWAFAPHTDASGTSLERWAFPCEDPLFAEVRLCGYSALSSPVGWTAIVEQAEARAVEPVAGVRRHLDALGWSTLAFAGVGGLVLLGWVGIVATDALDRRKPSRR